MVSVSPNIRITSCRTGKLYIKRLYQELLGTKTDDVARRNNYFRACAPSLISSHRQIQLHEFNRLLYCCEYYCSKTSLMATRKRRSKGQQTPKSAGTVLNPHKFSQSNWVNERKSWQRYLQKSAGTWQSKEVSQMKIFNRVSSFSNTFFHDPLHKIILPRIVLNNGLGKSSGFMDILLKRCIERWVGSSPSFP